MREVVADALVNEHSGPFGQLVGVVIGLVFAGLGAVFLTNWRGLADAFVRQQWRMVASYISAERREQIEERQRRTIRVVGAGFLLFGLVVVVVFTVGLVRGVVG